jgi:hypothetical protein
MGLKRTPKSISSAAGDLGSRYLVDAIHELRGTVLVQGAEYGVALAGVRGDLSLSSEWREWIEWTRQCFRAKVAEAAEFETVFDGRPLQEWGDLADEGPARLLEFLAAFEERSGEPLPSAAFDDWRSGLSAKLEALSGYARSVEILGADPLCEVEGEAASTVWEFAGAALLGALEDSIALMFYGKDEDRELCATGGEMYRLLIAARKSGVWSFLDHSASPSATEAISLNGPSSLKLVSRVKEQRDDLVRTSSSSFAFYVQLAPDGREFDDDEREAAIDRLRVGAACLRRVARERALIDLLAARGVRAMSVGPTIAVMRTAHRSLVLAMSDDPQIRQRAIAPKDLGARYLPVHNYWIAPEQRMPDVVPSREMPGSFWRAGANRWSRAK